MAGFGPLWACAGGVSDPAGAPPVAWRTRGRQTARAGGPLRDIDPAVRYVASWQGMAVLQVTHPEADRIVYDLITVGDEPATLTVGLPPDLGDDPVAPGDLAMEARIGRFGDVERERAFVRGVRARLEALRKSGGVAPGP